MNKNFKKNLEVLKKVVERERMLVTSIIVMITTKLNIIFIQIFILQLFDSFFEFAIFLVSMYHD